MGVKEAILMTFVVMCIGVFFVGASLWQSSKIHSLLSMLGSLLMVAFLIVGLNYLSQSPMILS